MIDIKCFTRSWLDEKSKELKYPDIGILEKCIYALHLVSALAQQHLSFAFKGGTSLLLHLPVIRRLSIDVDVLCTDPPEAMLNALKAIGENAPFTAFEHLAHRDKELPPKKHYRLHYNSKVNRSGQFILVDVMYDQNPYSNMESKFVNVPFVLVAEKIPIPVPSLNGLLGDKLTAFAPKTVGVLFEKQDSHMQIVKQVFDVGELFNSATDITEVNAVHGAVFELENRYRGNKFTRDHALDDTVEASFALSQCQLKKAFQDDRTRAFMAGIRSLENHIIGTPFRIESARTAAAKAALLATALKHETAKPNLAGMRYTDEKLEIVKDSQLGNARSVLNRLKAINPEAFYYWWLIQSMEEGHDV